MFPIVCSEKSMKQRVQCSKMVSLNFINHLSLFNENSLNEYIWRQKMMMMLKHWKWNKWSDRWQLFSIFGVFQSSFSSPKTSFGDFGYNRNRIDEWNWFYLFPLIYLWKCTISINVFGLCFWFDGKIIDFHYQIYITQSNGFYSTIKLKVWNVVISHQVCISS